MVTVPFWSDCYCFSLNINTRSHKEKLKCHNNTNAKGLHTTALTVWKITCGMECRCKRRICEGTGNSELLRSISLMAEMNPVSWNIMRQVDCLPRTQSIGAHQQVNQSQVQDPANNQVWVCNKQRHIVQQTFHYYSRAALEQQLRDSVCSEHCHCGNPVLARQRGDLGSSAATGVPPGKRGAQRGCQHNMQSSLSTAGQRDIFMHVRHPEINIKTSVKCVRVLLRHVLADSIKPQISTLGSVLGLSCLASLDSRVEEEEEDVKVNTQRTNALRSSQDFSHSRWCVN